MSSILIYSASLRQTRRICGFNAYFKQITMVIANAIALSKSVKNSIGST